MNLFFSLHILIQKSFVVDAAIKVSAQLFKHEYPIEIDFDSIIQTLSDVSNPSTESTDSRRDAILVLMNIAKTKHNVRVFFQLFLIF